MVNTPLGGGGGRGAKRARGGGQCGHMFWGGHVHVVTFTGTYLNCASESAGPGRQGVVRC